MLDNIVKFWYFPRKALCKSLLLGLTMKKIYKILTALFGSIALSATAAPIAESKAVFPQQCLQLFKETENLIAQAEKQPGTHTQVGKIKSKLNQSKQQILEMELATQQKSCDVGLARLNSMKSYTEGTEGAN